MLWSANELPRAAPQVSLNRGSSRITNRLRAAFRKNLQLDVPSYYGRSNPISDFRFSHSDRLRFTISSDTSLCSPFIVM